MSASDNQEKEMGQFSDELLEPFEATSSDSDYEPKPKRNRKKIPDYFRFRVSSLSQIQKTQTAPKGKKNLVLDMSEASCSTSSKHSSSTLR